MHLYLREGRILAPGVGLEILCRGEGDADFLNDVPVDVAVENPEGVDGILGGEPGRSQVPDPILMVFGSLVLRPGVTRRLNIAVGIVYVVTIIAGAIGEWGYYVLGSLIEVLALAAILYHAWTWPKQTAPLGHTPANSLG
jgi:hypothetical protein